MAFQRPYAKPLATRLAEPRRFLQVVAGPRQVGKSTLVQQVVEASKLPHRIASADEPTLRGPEWIAQQWDAARLITEGRRGSVLVLDETQKIPGWSEVVKRLWDEDSRHRLPLKVMLLGSAPLLVARGLSESLTGRFELLHLPHWSFAEMRRCVRLVGRKVHLLRRLSGGRTARWRAGPLGPLHPRRADRNVDLARRVAAYACR